jgi:hypothetical protein
LPKNRRYLEELPPERCDEYPVEQAGVKPEKVFQNAGARYNTAASVFSRLETLLLLMLAITLLILG